MCPKFNDKRTPEDRPAHDYLGKNRKKISQFFLKLEKKLLGSYPAWNIGHEKAVGMIGATVVHSGQQAQPWDAFRAASVWRCLSAMRKSFCVMFWPSTKHGSIGTHQRPRNSRNRGLLWDLQGVTYVHRLPEKGPNGHTALLCRISGPIRRQIVKKGLIWRRKCALPLWHRTGSHLRRHHGQIGLISLRTAGPSTVFYKFGLVELLFVTKFEKFTRQAEIWVELAGFPRHGGRFCPTSRKRIFQTA